MSVRMRGREAGRGGRRVVVLDKDGTLIEDLPYNVDPERIRLAPTAAAAIRRLGEAGFELAIATNQSGVARGWSTLDDLVAVGDRLAELVEAHGSRLAAFHACPHLPGVPGPFGRPCRCRKPAPGLLLRTIAELGLDPATSWFVGDTWMDVAAGRAAGMRTALVGNEAGLVGSWAPGVRPELAVRYLDEAASAIVAGGPA